MAGRGRTRRRWSQEEKRRIVAQTLMSGVSVSQVARRYDVKTNLVFKWPRDPQFRSAVAQAYGGLEGGTGRRAGSVRRQRVPGARSAGGFHAVSDHRVAYIVNPSGHPYLSSTSKIHTCILGVFTSRRLSRSHDPCRPLCRGSSGCRPVRPWEQGDARAQGHAIPPRGRNALGLAPHSTRN